MLSRHPKFGIAAFTALLVLLVGCDDSPNISDADLRRDQASSEAMTAAKEASMPFEDAEVFFEFNTTDTDLGLQIFLDVEQGRCIRSQ